jgi:hypothetical protein
VVSRDSGLLFAAVTRATVGDILPRADELDIPEEKLRGYVLNREHVTGTNKARVFYSALAVIADDWEYLRDQIIAAVQSTPIDEVRPGYEGGSQCSVVVAIAGRNGETRRVVTAWYVPEGDGMPHFVTAYIKN